MELDSQPRETQSQIASDSLSTSIDIHIYRTSYRNGNLNTICNDVDQTSAVVSCVASRCNHVAKNINDVVANINDVANIDAFKFVQIYVNNACLLIFYTSIYICS